jgi:hypothetical protein
MRVVTPLDLRKRLGTRETRETYAPDDSPSSLPDYAGLGAYLGELRHQAAIPG